MNKLTFIFGLVVALIIGSFAGAALVQHGAITGGDFAGGTLPSQIFTGSASGGPTGNGYTQPVGALALAGPNGLAVGGLNQFHALATLNVATGTIAATTTLGAFGATTSSATTSVALPDTFGLTIGQPCDGGVNTTTLVVDGCTLVTTSGATGTATVAYSNLLSAANTVNTGAVIFRVKFDQLTF